jgi:enoyl-CoA hydratase
MRYMPTGHHWGTAEAYRIGELQKIAADPRMALEAGLRIAKKVAQCGPLEIRTTLLSAHLAIDASEDEAFSRLDAQYASFYNMHVFQEGRDAEAQDGPPVYQGR